MEKPELFPATENPIIESAVISFEPLSGIIVVEGSGLNTSGGIDAYFAELEPVLVRERRRSGIARVLLDLRRTFVNPPEIASQIRQLSESVFRSGDRVAVVNLTALLRLQAKRVEIPHHRIFDDERQARDWLTSPLGDAWPPIG
jgi:hypothetical protein